VALEKATELGVSRIVPLAAARSRRRACGSREAGGALEKLLLEASHNRGDAIAGSRCSGCAELRLPITGKACGLSVRSARCKSLREVFAQPASKVAVLAIGPGRWLGQTLNCSGAGCRVSGCFAWPTYLSHETAVVNGSLAALTFALSD